METFGCCTNIMAHANIQEEEALCEYNIALNFSLRGFLDQLVNLAEKDKEVYEREKDVFFSYQGKRIINPSSKSF